MKQDVLACLCMSLVMKSVMGGPCTDTALPNNQMCTTITDEDQCSKSYGKLSQGDGVKCGWRDAQCLSTGPFCEAAAFQTLETDANTFGYFDFGTGKSWDGSAAKVTDLSTKKNDLDINNKHKFSLDQTLGGFLKTSSASTGDMAKQLGNMNGPFAMGTWAKLDGSSNRGLIWLGTTGAGQQMFVRIGGSRYYSTSGCGHQGGERAYDFGVAYDCGTSDCWWDSRHGSQDAQDYVTNLPNYKELWYSVVIYADASGNVYSSVDGSDFAFIHTRNGGACHYRGTEGKNLGQLKLVNPKMGIGADPHNDNPSSHSYGVAFWYQGEFTNAMAKGFYDRYAGRFGRS